MKVWLINPPETPEKFKGIRSVVSNLFYNSPPLGLGYLAAVLESRGHVVKITDCPVEQISASDTPGMASRFSPDLIGLTSTTTHYENALDVARRLHSAHPQIPLCIGGPHFNANPDLLLTDAPFSFGVQNEGEDTLAEVVQALADNEPLGDIPGVVTARDGQLHFGPDRNAIMNLDRLPFPARHLMPLHKYRPMPNDQYSLPKTSIITSRGCPFNCSFCDKSTFGQGYRSASPGRVLEELHLLHNDFGIRDVAFVDSVISPTQKRISAILDEMEKDPPGVSWTCSCRATILDEALVRRMRKAGCWRVRIAIESGAPEILESINKGLTKEQFQRAVTVADNAGLQVKGFFMIGHIGDTPETIEQSIAFATQLPLKDITVQINTPLRGTPQYELCREKGTLIEGDTSRYNFFQPVFIPEGMTADQLTALFKRFYRRFYLRPSLMWRHLKAIRNIGDVLKYLRALPLVLTLLFHPKKTI